MNPFLIKIIHPDGRQEGHVFHEYSWNPITCVLTICRDDMDSYTIDLSHGAVGYAQVGRETFSNFNKHTNNDVWNRGK